MCVWMCTWMCIQGELCRGTYVSVNAHMCVCLGGYICVWAVWVCVYVCVRVHMCVHVCLCVCMCP